MDSQEFAKRMREIADLRDENEESKHIRADALLCDALIQLGYEEGVEIYDSIDKWYA